MSSAEELDGYIRECSKLGMPRQQVVEALISEGWPEREYVAILDRYYGKEGYEAVRDVEEDVLRPYSQKQVRNSRDVAKELISTIGPEYEVRKEDGRLHVSRKNFLSTSNVEVDFSSDEPIITHSSKVSLAGIILSIIFFPLGTVLVYIRNEGNAKKLAVEIAEKLSKLQVKSIVSGKNKANRAAADAESAAVPCTDAEIKGKALVPVLLGAAATFVLGIAFCCFTYAGPFLGGFLAAYLLMRQFSVSRLPDYPAFSNPFVRYATISSAIGSLGFFLAYVWDATSSEGNEFLVGVGTGLLGWLTYIAIAFVGAWVAYKIRDKLVK